MRLVTFLLIFIFAVNNVKAIELIEISNYRDNFAAGETVQFDINFDGELDNDLSYSNLKLKNIYNVNFDVSYTIEKISDYRYYVYFNLPNNLINNTYKFIINNVDIYNGDDFVRVNKEVYFNVSNSNYSLSIYPGIFILNDESSSINFKNNLNFPLDILVSGNGLILEYNNINLGKKAQKNVQFRRDGDINNAEIKIDYGNKYYLIPIYFSDNEDIILPEVNITNITVNKKSVVFVESSHIINKNLFTNESISAPIRFYNNGDADLKNLNIEVSKELSNILKINQSSFSLLKIGEIKFFLVTINKDFRVKQGYYNGTIKLISDKVYDNIYVYLNFSEPMKVIIPKENITKKENITNGTLIIKPKEKSSNVKTILISIIVAILIIVVFILLRKKGKPKTQGKGFSYYLRR